MNTDEALKTYYLPRIQNMLKEHEEWCRAHPDGAAFLAALPNGGWRTGALAGEDEE